MSKKDKFTVLSIFLLTPVLLTLIIWPNLSKVMMGEVEELAPPEEVKMVHKVSEVGVVTQMLDASQLDWVYFSFEKGVIEKPEGAFPFISDEWDLAFQRKRFVSNSGRMNPEGKVSVLRLEETDFDTTMGVPVSGYQMNDNESRKIENTMTRKWYSYNFLKHKLTPKPDLFFIKRGDGKIVKMKIDSYYCGNDNTSACYTLKYKWM